MLMIARRKLLLFSFFAWLDCQCLGGGLGGDCILKPRERIAQVGIRHGIRSLVRNACVPARKGKEYFLLDLPSLMAIRTLYTYLEELILVHLEDMFDRRPGFLDGNIEVRQRDEGLFVLRY